MRFAIVVSKTDPAGMLMREIFARDFGFAQNVQHFDQNQVLSNGKYSLVTINESQIFADYCDGIDADFLIFASKHKSVSGKPTLTVHPIGNWGKAEMGGRDKTIVKTSAILMRNYIRKLAELKEKYNLSYDVALEVTHHGAFHEKPCVYIELGSSEKQWSDRAAAKAICETILSATDAAQKNEKIAIALGGNHYAPEFTKLVLRKDFAISHMCPEYALQNFDSEMLEKAIAATMEKIDLFVIDEKGLGGKEQKARLLGILGSKGLPIEKIRNLLK